MKGKKIISTIAAMSIIATSSMSFAAITFKNSSIDTLVNKKENAKIGFEVGTTINKLVAEKALEIDSESTADLSSTKVEAKAKINLGGKKVDEIKIAPGVEVENNDVENEPIVDTNLAPSEK